VPRTTAAIGLTATPGRSPRAGGPLTRSRYRRPPTAPAEGSRPRSARPEGAPGRHSSRRLPPRAASTHAADHPRDASTARRYDRAASSPRTSTSTSSTHLTYRKPLPADCGPRRASTRDARRGDQRRLTSSGRHRSSTSFGTTSGTDGPPVLASTSHSGARRRGLRSGRTGRERARVRAECGRCRPGGLTARHEPGRAGRGRGR
jgi:hypothetical protein